MSFVIPLLLKHTAFLSIDKTIFDKNLFIRRQKNDLHNYWYNYQPKSAKVLTFLDLRDIINKYVMIASI